MDETLRKEVRLLTTRLGAMVREQCGEKTFQAIENLRQLSKQIRQDSNPELLGAKEQEVNRLRLGEASAVAHAFSLFFHLVNLCEERQRVRRLREYERREDGAPMSLRHTFKEIAREKTPLREVERLLASMGVEPVLTAHPTEAKRRSVMNHLLRIGRTLESLNSHGPAAERAVDPWVEALWLTDEVRERSVSPEVEIENTLVYLEATIYDLAGVFWEKFQDELGRFAPKLALPPPFIRFGSWVGTDRDGNPAVTPRVSLRAAAALRQSILRYYRDYCDRLLAVLSFPCRGDSGLERNLARSLERDLRRFPATRAFRKLDQPHELYRRKLRVMIWRLERIAEEKSGAWRDAREFADEVALLARTVSTHAGPRVARQGPGRLATAAQVFGFHGASLDFRQHCSVTRAAVSQLLGAARLPAQPQPARIRSIKCLLAGRRGRLAAEGPARRALEEFRALREIQLRYGEASSHRYILSMTTCPADVWDLLLLGQQAGLIDGNPRRLRSSFDLIPLFETYDDLNACPEILEKLLADPLYRQFVRARNNFQEVMLGYSDSVKDSGYLAANWALLRAQKRLSQVAERHGVKLGLFHGKGGTIDRGGGLSHRTVQAQPDAAPGGRIRITEQGEVISLKYSNLAIAERNLEQLVTSVLDAHLRPSKFHPSKGELTEWEGCAGELAGSSRAAYRTLVYETPEFAGYFRQATPIDLIERLRIGSRPAHRYTTEDVRDLRAIPWVFAWTQSRHLLPAWYGLGYALEKFVNDHAPRGLELLREIYRRWAFFSVLIENAEISLAKTDLYIAGRYATLVRPASLGEKIFGRIREEYERSRHWVLEISQQADLLSRQPVLAESIRLRNPYVDPLNFLQIRFLDEWRRSRRPQPELLHLLQITVGGIAFGMKSTG